MKIWVVCSKFVTWCPLRPCNLADSVNSFKAQLKAQLFAKAYAK